MEHIQWMDTSFCPQCNSAMSSLWQNFPIDLSWAWQASLVGSGMHECSLSACHPGGWLPRMSHSITWLFWRPDGGSCLPHLSLMRRIWSLVKQPRAAWRNAKMAVKRSHERQLPLSLYIFHWSVTKMMLCILNNKKNIVSFNKYILAHFLITLSELHTKYVSIYRIVGESLGFDLDFRVLVSYFTVSNQ